MKKKIIKIIVLIIIIFVVLGVGFLIALNAMAKRSKNAAFADAGIEPSSVKFVHTEFDFEYGTFICEVDFISEGTEYEYMVKAFDGTIIKKEYENNNSGYKNNTNQPQQNEQMQISLDEAKNTALSDADLSSSDVTYTKEMLDYEDGVAVYDIEFYTSTYEYEYEINATSGTILNKDTEVRKNGTGNINDNNNSNKDEISDNYIGVDNAKSIAVSHAGFSVSDVSFSKAKLETDDGQMVYEVDFYMDGKEYEYTIHATSGTILEYDMD